MIKNWYLYFILLFPVFIFSQDQKEYVYRSEILQPGTTTSISFKIENITNEDKVYDLAIETSDPGIKTLQSASKITVEKGKSFIYIIPIRISADTPKGTYTISLHIKDENGVKLTKYSPLVISGVRKLSLVAAEAPEYVKAGDTIKASFIVKNNGNMSEKLFLKAENAHLDVGSEITVPPGETRLINLRINTKPEIGNIGSQSVHLNALTENHPKENLDAFRNVTIIPLKPVDKDIYYRFPVAASINYIGRRDRGKYQDGFQGEIYGIGSLSDKNEDILEFHAVTKNPIEINSFTPYEEYYVSYKRKNLFAHLGDKSYSASYLTEFARYGRGAELNYQFKKITVGGFYNHPRFFRDIKDEFNVYSKFNFNNQTEITAGYLYKIPFSEEFGLNTHLPYVAGKARLLEKIDVQGEVAYSKNRQNEGIAYMVQAQGNFNKVSAGLIYMKSTPLFAGYFTNTNSIAANIQYRISDKINVSANYREDARNFKRDTLYGVAPYQKFGQLGFNYKYSSNGSLLIFGGYQNYEDRMKKKQFNYEEIFLRAGINQELGIFRIGAETQFGRTNNFLQELSGQSSSYTLNFGLEKFKTTLNLYGSYAKTSRYEFKDYEQIYYGARLMSRFNGKSSLSIFYQNNYIPEQTFNDRNLFEILYHQQLLRNHEFDISGRYTLQRGQIGDKDFTVSMRYTLRINAPIKKIAEYVTLSGNITNLGVKKVNGIKLTLGNQITVTDKDGNYHFKNVPPGNYFLELDRSTTEITEIPDVPFPAEINLINKENIFNFSMTKAAKIEGFIQLNENEGKDQYSFAQLASTEKKKKESIILEATNGKQVFRKICTVGENFDFTYLRPGNWKLHVYRNGLDKRYKIPVDQFDFTLKSDESKNILINITKQQREIKFQQESVKVSYNDNKKK